MVIVHLGHVPLEAHHHLRLYEAYARSVRVIYVEMGRWGEQPVPAAFRGDPGLERRSVPPRIPVNRLPAVARWNWWLAARAILAGLRRQRISGRVLITQNPDLLPTFHGLDADLTVYQIIDDYVGLADQDHRRRVARGHRRMLREAAFVWATSSVLVEDALRHRGEAHLVGQGVEHAAFAAATAPPPSMTAIASPRIGSVGNINDRIDWALIEGIARARPGWNLVFVGPVYKPGPLTHKTIARLGGLPNVHFLPEVRREMLPAVIAGLDVGLILYTPGPGTRGINPLKLYQYLAAGRPVVATPLPPVEEFRDCIAIASTVDEFVAAIEAALRPGDPEARAAARRRRALDFDWDRIAVERLRLLGAALARGAMPPAAPAAGPPRLPIR